MLSNVQLSVWRFVEMVRCAVFHKATTLHCFVGGSRLVLVISNNMC